MGVQMPVTTRHGPGLLLASRLTAIVLVVLAVLISAAGLALYALTHQNLAENGGQIIVIFVSFVTVGLVLAWHRPGNPIGWIILGGVAFQGLSIDASLYVTLAHSPGYHLPTGPVVWLLGYSWFVGICTALLVILLFPDGAPPSRRWRWVMWAYLATVGSFATVVYAFVIGAFAGHHTRLDASGQLAFLDHQAGLSAATKGFGVLELVFWLSFVAAQVLSWRRSSGERRQQLKWLMAGAAVLVVSQAIYQPIQGFSHLSAAVLGVLNTVSTIGFAALPAGLAVAILKYRLYDIDRIISRTLAYSIVTGLLVGVYAGLVLLATQVLGIKSAVAVAGSTLVAAALFNPLRARVQRTVDRRFNRARYDADQMVAAFASRLKDAVDSDAVQADLARVVQHALEPAHVSMWMNNRS